MHKSLILLVVLLGCTNIRDIEDTTSDKEVSTKSGTECVCPPAGEETNTTITYFSQWDNSISPGSTCQNTSIAMLLTKFNWWGNPDSITREWGKDYAQSPSGLANVFNELASRNNINARLTPVTNGTLEEFRDLLRLGKPTIVHGYFTGYGHVLLALAFDGTHYTVNDPAGCWNEGFKGGYGWCPSGMTGEGIRYPKAAFERAISTSDGYTYLPLWYHILN